MNFPLTKLYNTYAWSASSNSDWHTMNDDCKKHIMCDGSLSFGVFNNEGFWKSGDKWVSYVRFCKKDTVVTWLGGKLGCMEWFFAMDVQKEEAYGVYRPGIPYLERELKTDINSQCKVMSIETWGLA